MNLLEALQRAYDRSLPPDTMVEITDRTGVFADGKVGKLVHFESGLALIMVGSCPQLLRRTQFRILPPVCNTHQ